MDYFDTFPATLVLTARYVGMSRMPRTVTAGTVHHAISEQLSPRT